MITKKFVQINDFTIGRVTYELINDEMNIIWIDIYSDYKMVWYLSKILEAIKQTATQLNVNKINIKLEKFSHYNNEDLNNLSVLERIYKANGFDFSYEYNGDVDGIDTDVLCLMSTTI